MQKSVELGITLVWHPSRQGTTPESSATPRLNVINLGRKSLETQPIPILSRNKRIRKSLQRYATFARFPQNSHGIALDSPQPIIGKSSRTRSQRKHSIRAAISKNATCTSQDPMSQTAIVTRSGRRSLQPDRYKP